MVAAGGWETYRCDRCPLVLELGGYTAWDDAGLVLEVTTQLACAGCGTMHRLIQQGGVCQVVAIRGPVRTARIVTERDCTGEEFEHEVWVAEDDWQPVGQCQGGVGAVGQLTCSYCARVGQMLSHEDFTYPGGYAAGAICREQCPVCRGPMEGISITSF